MNLSSTEAKEKKLLKLNPRTHAFSPFHSLNQEVLYDICRLLTADFLTINIVMRVPNRFFGIPDLAYLKAGIRDFEGK